MTSPGVHFGTSTVGRQGLAEAEPSPTRVAPNIAHLGLSKALILIAAGLSFLLSVSLWFLVDREQGLFVGIWVPSILSLGNLLLTTPGGQR